MEDYKRLIKNRKPDIRHLNDMKEVVYDKEWVKNAPNYDLYYMYRKVKEQNGLVNHITVVPPRMLGKEYVKTKGHYHTRKKYGEIYAVLEGRGVFLSQKEKNGIIEDVFCVKAEKGEYVVIPPAYGHVMINDSSKDLITIDWSSEECRGDYSLITEKGGACYFYTKSGWIKNDNYEKVPELRFEKPKKTMPENLDFLYGK
jgi:glucose-6-phosphate isomerase